jgi:hypothetical protein
MIIKITVRKKISDLDFIVQIIFIQSRLYLLICTFLQLFNIATIFFINGMSFSIQTIKTKIQINLYYLNL